MRRRVASAELLAAAREAAELLSGRPLSLRGLGLQAGELGAGLGVPLGDTPLIRVARARAVGRELTRILREYEAPAPAAELAELAEGGPCRCAGGKRHRQRRIPNDATCPDGVCPQMGCYYLGRP